jgi:hypothetical protein
MPNLLQTGAAWLGEQMRAHAGRVVTVQQGATTINGLTAWHQAHTHTIISEEGLATQVRTWDWRFVAADLPDGFEFRAGAEIKDGGARYEVVPLGSGPCAEPADSSGVLLTVHTQRVG